MPLGMAKPHKIERLYAWIVTEPDGEDGIPAFRGSDGVAMPMVGSDKDRIESLRPRAMRIAHDLKMPVKLVEFTGMVVLEAHKGPTKTPEEAYRDDSFPERDCDHCGKPYKGPAVYCSLHCAMADA